jgi:hypothetical protein
MRQPEQMTQQNQMSLPTLLNIVVFMIATAHILPKIIGVVNAIAIVIVVGLVHRLHRV